MNRPAVCRNYVAGYCRFGTSCWYDHPSRFEFVDDSRPPPLLNDVPIPLVQPLFSVDINDNNTHVNRFSYSQVMSDRAVAHYRNLLKNKRAVDNNSNKFILSPHAKPFVPRRTNGGAEQRSSRAAENTSKNPKNENEVADWKELMCPYYEDDGKCNEEYCLLIHGEKCDMCDRYILHPTDEHHRMAHKQECLAEHEKAMAEAFANQLSAEKQCGICMENVHEQSQRFGILNKCKHSYCLRCIREWRKTTGTINRKATRSCPECRVVSDFVIPSNFWVEDEAEKKKLIDNYISNMKSKICKYMSKGNVDDCPFGNKCFYKHQLPDGRIAVAGAPRRRRNRSLNDDNIELIPMFNGLNASWLTRVHIAWASPEDSSSVEIWDRYSSPTTDDDEDEDDDVYSTDRFAAELFSDD
ncbi:putative E3 ubiquitin-protein ligase makorin-2 [Aphelenchoides besseyi]|nr:putative E3 ubiquitin-protein ligase makorin-2 [Aphelenchoides besseyi]